MILDHEGKKTTPKTIAKEILWNYIDMMLDGRKYDEDREAKLTAKEDKAIYNQVRKLANRALRMTDYGNSRLEEVTK